MLSIQLLINLLTKSSYFSIVSIVAHQKFNSGGKMFFNEKIKINIFDGSGI